MPGSGARPSGAYRGGSPPVPSALAASSRGSPRTRSQSAVRDPSEPLTDAEALFTFADVRLGNAHRELADAQDVGRALGDADAAARIQNVEQVRALQRVLEGRPHQRRGEQPL